jgi:hypothetical protein
MVETAMELLLRLSWMALPGLELVHVLVSEPQLEPVQGQELA